MKEEIITLISAYRGNWCNYEVNTNLTHLPRVGKARLKGELIVAMEKGQCLHLKLHLREPWDIQLSELCTLGDKLKWEYITEYSKHLKRLKVLGGASIDFRSDGTFWIDTNTADVLNYLRQMGFCMDPILKEKGLVTYTKSE